MLKNGLKYDSQMKKTAETSRRSDFLQLIFTTKSLLEIISKSYFKVWSQKVKKNIKKTSQ